MRASALLLSLLLTACGSDDEPSPNANTGGTGGAIGSGGAAGTGGAAGAGGGIQSGLDVTLPSGQLAGTSVGGVRVFRGIPYAEPPVGPLRWKPPQKKQPWSGVRDAKKVAAKCAQFDILGLALEGQEDCLTLDVWTPDPAPTTPRPVMVWIHGGGFISGSGTNDTYDGQNIVTAGDVVQVNINYRLGPLGFLSHPELTAEDGKHPSSGNYGFEDQQAALSWVKENILAFGGDPEQVTIFGQSAGALSVGAHLVAPGSAGKFVRAIIQSGPFIKGIWPSLSATEAQGGELAKALACTDIACLRGKSQEELLKALPLKKVLFFGNGVNWTPNVDGFVFTESPSASFAAGKAAKVPVLLGANSEEGEAFTLFGGVAGIDEAGYQTQLASLGKTLGFDAAKVLAEYPAASYASPTAALTTVITDGFVCSTRGLARNLSKSGTQTFLYHFSQPITVLGATHSMHSAELAYVFGTTFLENKPTGPGLALSKSMLEYWTRMGSTGDPNGGSAVSWPKYEAASDSHLGLDLEIKAGTGLKSAACDFWDTL